MATDPLLALRHAITSHSPITYVSNDEPVSTLHDATGIRLSPTAVLSKTMPTRFRKAAATGSDPAHFLSLEALLFTWLVRDASATEYMRQVREAGLGAFVSVTDRQGVVEWLEGKSPDHERIVPLPGGESSTPPGTPPQGSGGLPQATTPTTSPGKRRYVADTSDIEAVKKLKREEVELRDRTTVLRGVKPNNFTGIRTAVSDRLKKIKEVSKSGAAPVASVPKPDPKMVAKKARKEPGTVVVCTVDPEFIPGNNFPIIIISSSPTSLITMHNVKRFLQESVFESSAEARARAAAEGNSRADDLIPIYRRRTQVDTSGKETETRMRYFVVDGVDALKKFGDDAWDRVVCVMTTGQAWQFRPYKWPEPRQLFHHVKGIHVSWSNDPPNPKIKDWNVSEMKIDPHRRHVDKSVVAHFWKMLDTWTTTNKPWLLA